MPLLPPSVEAMFLAAGWRPSARGHAEAHAAATAEQRAAGVVAEYAGLQVWAVRAGLDLPAQ
jgi:hypothetical protein